MSEKAFWTLAQDAAFAALGSQATGLSTDEAKVRRRRIGPNSVESATRIGPLQLFLRQIASPLVIILLFGAGVSALLRDFVDAGIILAIVLVSTLLGFYQEYRAGAAVEELKRHLALKAKVWRDGVPVPLPASDIVPGDIIELSAGNLIPADGLILAANDFMVSEASLTGESFPVEKRPGQAAETAALSERNNAVFLGTSVRSGTARVLVAETGSRTAFGAIAGRLKARAPETEFQRGIRQFGYLLIRVMIVIVLFVLTVNLLLGRPIVESLLFAVALAVGLSPELLPAIVSVTLSRGARLMARQGVIVRRLEAIENLGSMDVLCTDKTGTLTAGIVTLDAAVDPTGQPSAAMLQAAYLNAALETGIENALDGAIMAAGEKAGLAANAQKIDEIPYDFIRKRLTIVVKGDAGRHRIITKGAFAQILEVCTAIDLPEGRVALDETHRQSLEAYFAAKSQEGFRVLALSQRDVDAKMGYDHADEADMVFAGFLLFFDPAKPDAAATLTELARLGIRTKIISGDNRYVTAHLAASVGLRPEAILTGPDIADMREEALFHLAPQTDLFVEVDPQQKERIVRALQKSGHAVGYLGDGINDAPALHAADVGISVHEAVDVARESADIILLERDLGVLKRGVENGRRAFANTLKYISITTSANFGNMISMAVATPLLPFLPLAAKQILLNNFLSDLPSLAIATDNVDAQHMEKAQRWRIADVQRFMVAFGLISSVFDLITFAVLIWGLKANEPLFQTVWFAISLLTELAVVLVLRTRGPAWASRPSALLFWMTLAVSGLALFSPFLGPVSTLFGFVPPSLGELAFILAVVAAYVGATEIAKRWVFRPRV
ncbi:magnesium-translocating P-type ATPase [Dongia sp.]|uniref:magnesium-translocating P-type ATPase n=1 Tax=Dongia sp. TaxID=1977262 RepID=UPI0035B0BF15